MAKFAERRLLPYTPEQLFDLVADVERYPQFLPWCVAARVRSRQETLIVADLEIGFKLYRERFTSRVTLERPIEGKGRIDTTYSEGPFKYLKSEWRFDPGAEGGCIVDFYVDFEFRSHLLQRVIEAFFGEAVRRMVSAFETRARALYGRGVPGVVTRVLPRSA